MRSAARLASVIEILEKVEDENLNIDHLLIRYFKQRRYAGSKDRRQIRERIYRIVRNRFKLEWWLQEVCLLYTSPSPRDVEECRMPSSA